MNAIRAYSIVKVIASCGIAHAEALYGRDACNQARFTLRATVARKQARRARAAGALAKRCARGFNRRYDADGAVYREWDMQSRRQYRQAARYDRTATVAADLAWLHAPEGHSFRARLQGLRDRLAHMPTA